MIFRMTEHVNVFPTDKSGFFALHGQILNGLYAERVNPFPTDKSGFFALRRHILNGLYAKNSPPRRTRRGPPLFEKRLVPGFGIYFCAALFLTHRITERVNPFPTDKSGFFALHRHILNGHY